MPRLTQPQIIPLSPAQQAMFAEFERESQEFTRLHQQRLNYCAQAIVAGQLESGQWVGCSFRVTTEGMLVIPPQGLDGGHERELKLETGS